MDRYAQATKVNSAEHPGSCFRGCQCTKAIIEYAKFTPAVSLSADGGHHGSHCYDEDGLLICGWPNEHNQYLNGYNLRERGQRYVDTEKLIGEE